MGLWGVEGRGSWGMGSHEPVSFILCLSDPDVPSHFRSQEASRIQMQTTTSSLQLTTGHLIKIGKLRIENKRLEPRRVTGDEQPASALCSILSQHLQAGSHPWSLGLSLSPA